MIPAPLAWAAAFGGSFLVWSAITGKSPTTVLRSALSGKPGGPTPLPTGSSGADTTAGASTTVGAGGSGTHPSVAALGGTVTSYVNNWRIPPQTPISAGGGHKLASIGAAQAYETASSMFGAPIPITDSFRSSATQAACHAAKPDTCAPPGYSMHELGLAIDVDGRKVDYNDPWLVNALSGNGWSRFSPDKEPWHWSWGITR